MTGDADILSCCSCLLLQETILLRAYKECHSVLMQCNNQTFHKEPKDFYMCKHILNVRPYKVSQEPVSIHLPISRLLAGRTTNIWNMQRSNNVIFFWF